MKLSRHIGIKLSAALLSAAVLITPVFAASGTVNATSGLNLRSGAGTGTAILTTLPHGTQVEVTGVTAEGWYQVTYQNYQGYVCGTYLDVKEEEAPAQDQVDESVCGRVTDGPLNVRSAPDITGTRIRQLAVGTVVQILGEENGWYQISDGFICGDYVQILDASEVNSADKRAQVVAYAKQFLGCPYVYAGVSPSGFDCSGFTQYVYAHFGIALSHASSAQIYSGTRVSRSELLPGDLVFFSQTAGGPISHVGLYIGNGEFIHASTPATGVMISSMNISVFSNGFVGACRLL